MANRDPSSPTPMPTILQYGIAVLSVVIANGLAFYVLRHFEAILTPFLFAVAATVWYAGTGPGVLAIVLSVVSLNHFFLRPDFSFSPISYADLVYLTFCIFCALAVGWVSAVRRRVEQELRQARDELEAKVLERTANLQRSESYLAETQKLTHTGSWAWDARSQKVLYCSEEMFRIYGLDPQVDLPTRKNFRQRVHPEDRNRTDERFVRVVNEKVDSFDEYRVLLPDGTVKHVISSGHPVLDENGEFIAFIGTATDVTERKRAEEALQESEAKIRRLVDSNIIGIFVWDFDGRILEANDEFLRMVSYHREDLVSSRIRWTELTPPDWRDRNNARIELQKSSGRFEPFEKEFTRKDGSRVPILIGGATFEEGGNQGVAFVLDLTERKCAEEALREREAKIRRLVDSNIIGIFIWDFDGRILEANDEFLRMVDYDREDLVSGRIRWTDLTPPDWRERDNAKIEQQKISGRLEPFEKEYTRKDGRRVPVLIGVATFEEGGNEGVAFVLDLTERKCAEEALRESEYKLRRIFNTVPGMLWSAGPDGEHTHINQRVLDYSGVRLEDFVHLGWHKRHHPDDLSHVANAFSHALRTGTSYQVLSRLRRADGEYRWHHIRAEPLCDRQGHIIQWYGLSVDIDEAKKAEQALREREAELAEARRELRLMIDTIPIPVASYSADARRDFVNAAWKQYTGLSDEAARGTEWSVVAHPDDTAGGNKMWRDALATGEPWHTEERVRRADGQYRWFAIDRVAARGENGKIIKWYGTAYDIEDRKRAEERLRVQHTVAQILADAATIEEAIPRILRAMGECLGWDVGALWRLEREAEALRCVELWHKASIEVPEFERVSREFTFIPGLGLPGRVWSSLEPEYVPDVVLDENFPRGPVAEREGLHAAFGFPILLGGEVLGVIEFFSREIRQPDQELLNMLATIGSQIGQFIERKRAEEALRGSEAKFRDYAESASDWYWETGPDHKFTHLTEDERRLARGVTTVSRIGVARWEFATDVQSEPEKWELHRSMLKARQPFRDFVYRATHGDGSVVYNKISGKPVFGAKGEFRGYRGTGTDVTALRTVEAQARESERRYRETQLELAHANRVATMGQLTASITHEVNQPITAAVTYASAARRFLSLEPPNLHEVDEALSLIVKEGNRAGEVVGRIRALIKKAPARKDAVEINDAILEIVALTRTEAANNSVSVRTQLTEGLPRVQGDRVQLQQVLLNLIINAIEAMRDVGEEDRELLVSTRHEPDGVSVEVRDSGPGFVAADLDRVFDAFYSTKPSGVGLGLSICRSIIEAHNGRLWANPNVPRGAIVGFTAPAHPAAAS
jgi:PAS domain S-box-containing protein